MPKEQQRSKWPTVIGIIAIVLGALGALGGVAGVVSNVALLTVDSAPAFYEPGQFEVLKRWSPWNTVMSVAGTVLAAWLLIGGIGLVSRRPWARPALLWWSGIKIVLVIVSVPIGYQVQSASMNEVTTDPNVVALSAEFADAAAGFGACVALVWGWALPVFLLIWLLRARIREEVATWR